MTDSKMIVKKYGRSLYYVTLERVMRCLLRSHTPLYIGAIAIEASCSIKQANESLQYFVGVGAVRRLTVSEMNSFGYDLIGEVWKVEDRSKFPKILE